MKKLYSTIMLLAMMVAALSLTACGGGDEEDGGDCGDSSSLPSQDYLEVSIDGAKYKHVFIGPFDTIVFPTALYGNGLGYSSSPDYKKFDGYLDFDIGIFHKRGVNALLQSSLTTYNVIDNIKSDKIHHLTLYIYYNSGYGVCEVTNGTHRVTAIKEKNGSVIICGTFEASLKDVFFTYEVSGKYQVTIFNPVGH